MAESLDLLPVVRSLHILDKQKNLIPFEPNWAQRQVLQQVKDDYEAGRPTRIITLKARQVGLCLHPDTLVLTADLRWVRIDDLFAGDEVVAVDEMPPGGMGSGRKMRTASVLARRTVYEEAFRLEFDSGESLIATAQHRFLGKVRGGKNTVWRSVSDTRAGDVVRYVARPWGPAAGYEDGWFGGMLDGEGSFRQKTRAGVEATVSQKPGPVLDRAIAYAKERGYTFRLEMDMRKPEESGKFGTAPVGKLVMGQMGDLFRLIGQTRPTRFLGRRWWEEKDLPGRRTGKAWSRVIAVTPLGPQRMVDIQTTTKTFVANGFVSHNSTITEAIIFAKAVLVPNTQAVVASLDTQQAEYLFDMTKRFYDSWAFKRRYPPKYASKRELFLTRINSDIVVKTGENPKAFRGRTYTDAHLSEVAFWTKPVEAMNAINQGMPAVPGNFQLIESTANGMGNMFEEEYWKAKRGQSDYTAFFFPWWKHYEYIPCQGVSCHDGTCPTCEKKSKEVRPRDSEERALVKLGARKAHIAWRRWAIPNRTLNNIDLFHQEFPSTDEEAFIASGVNAFNLEDLKAVYEPLEPVFGDFIVKSGEVSFIPDPTGPFRIYKAPSEKGPIADKRWGEYFIGADSCYGVIDGDFAAAHVINRRTKEQVATFHARVSPGEFADKLALLAAYYARNDREAYPTIAVETEGGGIATIERLRSLGYPRIWTRRTFDSQLGHDRSETKLGWSTSWKTKAFMILTLAELVQKGKLTLHDEATFKELRTYSFYGDRGITDRFGPADQERGRDDLVMSLAITMVCESQEAPLGAYEVVETPGGIIWPKERDEEDEW